MPDDRPESPREAAIRALAYAQGNGEWFDNGEAESVRGYRDKLAKQVRAVLDALSVAALSTPAGPSPEPCLTCHGTGSRQSMTGVSPADPRPYACPDCKGTGKATHREEGPMFAEEPLTNEESKAMLARWREAALSAARPSSPTPEESERVARWLHAVACDPNDYDHMAVAGRDAYLCKARELINAIRSATPGDAATTKEGR